MGYVPGVGDQLQIDSTPNHYCEFATDENHAALRTTIDVRRICLISSKNSYTSCTP
jgi:hypothetical protein